MSTIHETNLRREFKPAEELSQLEMFTGNWDVHGKNLSGAPIAADKSIKGTVSYEWLAGGFFLVCRWDRDFGEAHHTGIGIIGYDVVRRTFITNNYDNMGFMRTYKFSPEKNTWTFSGERERATMIFKSDGKSFTESWEILGKDGNWKPLCILQGTKS